MNHGNVTFHTLSVRVFCSDDDKVEHEFKTRQKAPYLNVPTIIEFLNAFLQIPGSVQTPDGKILSHICHVYKC